MTPTISKHNNGFSLLELSIVLVIIGLIAGGIVAGASMIRAAELRSTISELQQYKTAIFTFRDKYLGLPGDLKNATAFWGEAHATLATCVITDSTGTETCNGNGDNFIWRGDSPVTNNFYEGFRFWQHLANAELISGNYTGTQSSAASWDSTIGVNIPQLKMSGAGMSMFSANGGAGTATWFPMKASHLFRIGAENPGTWSNSSIFTPQEAWNIDKKLDDGKPGYGNVSTWKATTRPNCATTDDEATAEYDLAHDGISCLLLLQ